VSKIKYVAASQAQRAWWDDLYHLDRRPAGYDSVVVIEAGADPQPTGLLDAQGNPLFRLVEKAPMGFRASNEDA
jgi:hypothetical protein